MIERRSRRIRHMRGKESAMGIIDSILEEMIDQGLRKEGLARNIEVHRLERRVKREGFERALHNHNQQVAEELNGVWI